ncbi:hypothetical protein [Candidatus Avelusimicrobium stercoris]|uniref:hypothetical protein n=1 Tax=Candidatus Avelusimicrobium stercoris TaxID=1947924 RepID=UPI003D14FA52
MTSFFALVFSLVAPGAGQIFTGHYAEGIILGVAFALGKSVGLPLLLRVFKVSSLKRTLQFFYACNWCYILLIAYAVCSAVWHGFYAQHTHAWYAILAATAISLAYRNTLNAFVFTALCGRTGVYSILRQKKQSPTGKIEK